MSAKKFIITPGLREAIKESARKIFGDLPVLPYRTGTKLFRRKPVGPIAVQHYLPSHSKDFKSVSPDYQDEIEERRALALERLRRTGRGPPKKGHGKRAQRRKPGEKKEKKVKKVEEEEDDDDDDGGGGN